VKLGIHPDYHPVVFQDANTGAAFFTRSTITSSQTIEWETRTGVHTYPLVLVEVSSASHPFWTGRRTLDAAGQVEKFYRRYDQRPSSSPVGPDDRK
jgi:large subunit ribosomal protein L31